MKINELFEARESKVQLGTLIKHLWIPIVKKYSAMEELKGLRFNMTMSGDNVVNLEIAEPYEHVAMDVSTLHPDPEIAAKLKAKIDAKKTISTPEKTLWLKKAKLRRSAMEEITKAIIDKYPEVTEVGISKDRKGSKYTYINIHKIDFGSLEWGKGSNTRFKFKWDPDQKPIVPVKPVPETKKELQRLMQHPLWQKYFEKQERFSKDWSDRANNTDVYLNNNWVFRRIKVDQEKKIAIYKGKEFPYVESVRGARPAPNEIYFYNGQVTRIPTSFALIMMADEIINPLHEIAKAASNDEFEIKFVQSKDHVDTNALGKFWVKPRKK